MKYSSAVHQAKLQNWTKLIQDQQASNLTVDDWCKENNLSRNSFYYWNRLIKENLLDSRSHDIVPIEMPMCSAPNVIPATPVPILASDCTSLAPTSTPSLTISVNGISIEVTDDTSDILLTKVIKAVRNA